MIIRPYVFTDYLLMDRQPEQEWLADGWGMSLLEYSKLVGNIHNAVTAIVDEEIFLVGGIGFNSGWAGEAGFILSKSFRRIFAKHGKQIIKELIKYLDNSGFNMVYSAIDPDIPGAEKLAQLLGFKFIGKVNKLHVDNKAMNLYLRITEC
jgi:hypothetical protein